MKLGNLESEKPEKKPARKKKSKKRRAAVARVKPLPPPVPIDGPRQLDQSNLIPIQPIGQQPSAADSSATSSTSTEPKPGQPLSAEAEQILSGVDEIFSERHAMPQGEDASTVEDDGADMASLVPPMSFDVDAVENVLREGFDWLARRFESDHWQLTDNQVIMLGRPTAQLCSTLYAKLPDFLTRWCDSTPGLGALVIAAGVVIGPKVVTQVAISRERKRENNAGPQPVSRSSGASQSQPRVGPMQPRKPIEGQ